MDRAVIIGTFEFIGFHFCKTLLDEGYEVEGIHLKSKKEDEDPFLIEKRLEIGRNANFKEIEYTNWMNSLERIEKETLFLINYYDFYMKGERKEDLNILDPFFLSHLNNVKNSNSMIMLFFPIQWLNKSSEGANHRKNIIRLIRESNISYQAFYLPSIYGPWQPSEFIFQQFIMKQLKDHVEIHFNDREWVDDAIFIEDVVYTVLMAIKQESESSCILKSNIPNHWQKCAEYLSIPKSYSNNHKGKSFNIADLDVLTAKSTIEYSEGLEKQKRHFEEVLNWEI